MSAFRVGRQVIAKCQQSNTAARKELDWQGQLEALMDARRLVAHHAEVGFQQQQQQQPNLDPLVLYVRW
jgi:hypothetical protein